MKLFRAFFALALVLVFAVPAFAETQNVKVSGSLDAYWFYRQNFDLHDGNDSGTVLAGSTPASHPSFTDRSDGDDYFMSITQVQIAADLTDNVSTVINLINQRDWNADSDYSSGPGNEFDIQLDLAYVQLKEIFYSPLTLTIGRQDLLFGRGFIIGWNPQDPGGNIQAEEWTQIQSFDAIRATLDFSPWTLDFVYAKITENSHNAEDDKDLYIVNVNYAFSEYNAVAEVYSVTEIDRASLVGTGALMHLDTRGNDTYTIGGRAQFDPISQITLGGEVAYQFGGYRAAASVSSGPDMVDITLDNRGRSAWALDLFGTYRWDYEWKPEVTIEYVFLSGENDLSPTASGDYDAWNGAYRGPIYGWIHDYKELYFGTDFSSDQIAGQNLQHINLVGSIKPLQDLQLSVSYFYIWTDEDQHSTRTDPSTPVLDDEIGQEVDTAVIYNYTEDVTFAFYANWFIPGDLYESPEDDVASEYVSRVTVTF